MMTFFGESEQPSLHLVQTLAFSAKSLLGCTSLSGDSISSQVAEAEEKTAGGLLLTEAAKEKPSIGTVSDGRSCIPLSMLSTLNEML